MTEEDINRRHKIAMKLSALAADLFDTSDVAAADEAWTCEDLAELWQELGCGRKNLQPLIQVPPVRKRR